MRILVGGLLPLCFALSGCGNSGASDGAARDAFVSACYRENIKNYVVEEVATDACSCVADTLTGSQIRTFLAGKDAPRDEFAAVGRLVLKGFDQCTYVVKDYSDRHPEYKFQVLNAAQPASSVEVRGDGQINEPATDAVTDAAGTAAAAANYPHESVEVEAADAAADAAEQAANSSGNATLVAEHRQREAEERELEAQQQAADASARAREQQEQSEIEKSRREADTLKRIQDEHQAAVEATDAAGN